LLKSRRKRWVRHVNCTKETRNAYTVLVIKTEAKRSFVKQRCRQQDNIKVNPEEIGWGCRQHNIKMNLKRHMESV
jgi:hypothetical protein